MEKINFDSNVIDSIKKVDLEKLIGFILEDFYN